MSRWNYIQTSKKFFLIKLLCILMSVLLVTSLVNTQSIIYVRSRAVSIASGLITAALDGAQSVENSAVSVSQSEENNGSVSSIQPAESNDSVRDDLTTNMESSLNVITDFFGKIFAPEKAYAEEYTGPEDSQLISSDYNSAQYWWEKDENEPITGSNISAQQISGSGTDEDPYIVYNYDELCAAIGENKSAVIKLGSDINIPGDSQRYVNNPLLPGSASVYIDTNVIEVFRGKIIGNGKTLYTNSSRHDSIFKNLENATISDCTFSINLDWTEKLSRFKNNQDSWDEMALLATYTRGNVNISNVVFKGYIKNRFDDAGYDDKNIGAIISKVMSGTTNFENVSNSVSVSVGGTAIHKAGGFIGCTEKGA